MKKIISLVLVLVLALTAIGGTLAYFTDNDSATNTFVAGGVAIDLVEQERKVEDGKITTELVDFEQNKELFPIVGSAQGEKDALGLPTAANYVDKVVTVKNTGKTEAWIRAYFAIPSDLDDGYETFNAGQNILHFNFGNKVVDGKAVTTFGTEWNWKQSNGKWNYFETTMDGVKYNVYFADYFEPIDADETTVRFIDGVYLDSTVDMKDGKYTASGNEISLTGGTKMNEIDCPVFAVAVQKEGFANANEAVIGAFGEQYNPWGTAVENWQ